MFDHPAGSATCRLARAQDHLHDCDTLQEVLPQGGSKPQVDFFPISAFTRILSHFLASGVAPYQAGSASGGSCFATGGWTVPSKPPNPPMRPPAGGRPKKHCARTLNLFRGWKAAPWYCAGWLHSLKPHSPCGKGPTLFSMQVKRLSNMRNIFIRFYFDLTGQLQI